MGVRLANCLIIPLMFLLITESLSKTIPKKQQKEDISGISVTGNHVENRGDPSVTHSYQILSVAKEVKKQTKKAEKEKCGSRCRRKKRRKEMKKALKKAQSPIMIANNIFSFDFYRLMTGHGLPQYNDTQINNMLNPISTVTGVEAMPPLNSPFLATPNTMMMPTQPPTMSPLMAQQNIWYLDPNGNFIMSPMSLGFALGLAALGTKDKGLTRTQILQALRWDVKLKKVNIHNEMMNMLLDVMKKPGKGNVIKIVNKLWIQEKLQLFPHFRADAVKYYQSDLGRVDFKKSKKAVKTINKWVKKESDEMLMRLMDRDIVSNEEAGLVLVNGMYFHGQWRNPFGRGMTQMSPFFVNKNETMQVETMKANDFFRTKNCSVELGASLIELKYVGWKYSMVLILPNKMHDLATVESKINTIGWRTCLWDMYENYDNMEHEVTLQMPKFQIRQQFSLQNALFKIGMGRVFEENTAELTKISPKKNIYMGNLVHQSYIKVNEEGCRVITSGRSETSEPKWKNILKDHEENAMNTFIVNHPFMFVIQDWRTKAILHIGKIVRPTYELFPLEPPTFGGMPGGYGMGGMGGMGPSGTGTGNPGQAPATATGATPGTTPGKVAPAGTPTGATTGQTPGAQPGQTPGAQPGQTPGAQPGQTPGAQPGQTPGAQPAQTPVQNPGQVPGPKAGTQLPSAYPDAYATG